MWSFYVWKMKFSKFIIGFPKKKKFILFASANLCLFVPETKRTSWSEGMLIFFAVFMK